MIVGEPINAKRDHAIREADFLDLVGFSRNRRRFSSLRITRNIMGLAKAGIGMRRACFIEMKNLAVLAVVFIVSDWEG